MGLRACERVGQKNYRGWISHVLTPSRGCVGVWVCLLGVLLTTVIRARGEGAGVGGRGRGHATAATSATPPHCPDQPVSIHDSPPAVIRSCASTSTRGGGTGTSSKGSTSSTGTRGG